MKKYVLKMLGKRSLFRPLVLMPNTFDVNKHHLMVTLF